MTGRNRTSRENCDRKNEIGYWTGGYCGQRGAQGMAGKGTGARSASLKGPLRQHLVGNWGVFIAPELEHSRPAV